MVYFVGQSLDDGGLGSPLPTKVQGGSYQQELNNGTFDSYILQFMCTGKWKYGSFLGGEGADMGLSVNANFGNKVVVTGFDQLVDPLPNYFPFLDPTPSTPLVPYFHNGPINSSYDYSNAFILEFYDHCSPCLRLMSPTQENTSGAMVSQPDRTISIFPNPASRILMIEESTEVILARIYSIYGALICEMAPRQNSITVDQLPPGLYMVEFVLNNGTRKVEKLEIR